MARGAMMKSARRDGMDREGQNGKERPSFANVLPWLSDVLGATMYVRVVRCTIAVVVLSGGGLLGPWRVLLSSLRLRLSSRSSSSSL